MAPHTRPYKGRLWGTDDQGLQGSQGWLGAAHVGVCGGGARFNNYYY